jgi:hypothetical protein
MLRPAVLAAALVVPLLAGCEMLGIESPEKVAAAREAEGRAVGGACRHAGRAIEDCYTLNKRVDKAAIFAGWRDMNDYMRENKIDPVPPVLVAQAPGARSAADARSDANRSAEARPAEGDPDKATKAKPRDKDKDARQAGS